MKVKTYSNIRQFSNVTKSVRTFPSYSFEVYPTPATSFVGIAACKKVKYTSLLNQVHVLVVHAWTCTHIPSHTRTHTHTQTHTEQLSFKCM